MASEPRSDAEQDARLIRAYQAGVDVGHKRGYQEGLRGADVDRNSYRRGYRNGYAAGRKGAAENPDGTEGGRPRLRKVAPRTS